MADGQESFKIEIDTTQLDKGAQGVIDRFNEIEDAAERAGKGIDDAIENKNAARTAAQMDRLNDSLNESATAMEQAADAAGELSSATSAINVDGVAAGVDALSDSLTTAQTELSKTADAAANFNEQNANTNDNMSKVVVEMGKVSKSGEDYSSTLVKMLGGQEKYNNIIGALPPQLGNVIKRIEGMTKASLSFIATPLGAVLAAIALALGTLYTYFKHTEEGEQEFAKMTGYVNGIIGQLTDSVAQLGRSLYNVFDDPKKSAKDFGNLLQKYVENRIMGIYNSLDTLKDAMAAIFTADYTEETWKKIAKRGKENMFQNLGISPDYVNEASDKAEVNARLERDELNLSKQRAQWQVREEQLRNELKNLRTKMMTSGDAEKLQIEAKAQQLVNTIYQKRTEYAQEELRIQQVRMSLTENTTADYQKEAELQANLVRLEGEKTTEMMMFNRRAFSAQQNLQKTNSAIAKQTTNIEYLQKRQGEQQAREAKRLALQIEEKRIEGMDEGHEKTLATLKLQGEQEMLAIEEQMNNALMAKIQRARQAFDADSSNAGKVFDMASITFTEEEAAQWQAMIDAQTAIIEKKQAEAQQAERASWNAYLKEYGNYTQRIEAVQNEYAEKRKKAANDGEVAILLEKEKEEIEAVNQAFGVSATTFADLFADSSEKAVKDIQRIIDKYKMLVDYLQGGGITNGVTGEDKNGNKRKKTSVSLTDLESAGFDVKKIQELKPEDIKSITDALAKLESELGNRSPWQAFTRNIDEAIEKIKGGQISQGIEGIISSVQSFMPALKEFGTSLNNILGGDDNTLNNAFSGLDGLLTAGQGVSQFMAGDFVGGTMSAINGLSKMKDALSAIHDKKNEKRIKALQDNIDSLQESYGQLEKAVASTYSKVKQTNIEAEIANKQEQIQLIYKQIDEERDKKNTDNDRIIEWQGKIKTLQSDIDGLKDSMLDAIFGEDVNTAINNFATAYTNAWSNNTSVTKSARDYIRTMMQQMVTESIKSALESSKAIEKIRAKLTEFYADDYFSEEERKAVEQMAQDVAKDIDNQFGWANSLFNGTFSQDSTSGGFATMSQDSADELNGRFTALQMNASVMQDTLAQMHIEAQAQSEHLASIRSNTEIGMNYAMQSVDHLARIEKHTANLDEMNQRLYEIEKNTRNI